MLLALGVLAGAIVTAAMLHRSARRLPERDRLTGLPTHEAMARALRRAPAGAVLYLDLDRFELMNEAVGRTAADRTLARAAGLMSAAAGSDLLARIGGDEFAVLAEGASVEEAVVIAERMRRAIGTQRMVENGLRFDLTASIGIAEIDAAASGDPVRNARLACRAAKASGRNRIETYRHDLSSEARHAEDAMWSVRLKDALREGRIALDFQPIAGVSDARVSHYEVLVRIEEGGARISAGAFIPAAERSGLIAEIDRWVVAAALEHMSAERARGARIRCAINLSGVSLHDPTTLAFIEQELDTSGVDPADVTFEITETAAIDNLAAARRTIESLRARGCRFALDDFGKGVSSLTYLRFLPVDYLKIDAAFVRDLPGDHVNQAMVRALNELAHSLGIETIAEGVEDGRWMRSLEEIGVDYAQGFHVGRPSGIARGTIVLPDAPALAPSPLRAREAVLTDRSPCELLEFVDFLDRLDRRSRALRDAGSVPASAITRPDEFDAITYELVGSMRAQVESAIAQGRERMTLRLPLSAELERLARWSEPRMETLAGIARAGLVQAEWAAPMRILLELFDAVLAAIADRQPT